MNDEQDFTPVVARLRELGQRPVDPLVAAAHLSAIAAATTAAQTSTPASRESSTNSNSTGLIVIISGAALVLLAGIGFVIARDARRVAPAGDVQLNEARESRDSAARVRRRRARAKAARRQRKRNR